MTPKSVSALRSTQLGRIGTAPPAAPSPLADVAAAAKAATMRPRKQYAALEARILFDAAGAAAADHQFDDPAAQQREAQRIASEEAKAATLVMDSGRENAAPTLPAVRGNTVVVIDSRVTDYQSLLVGIDPSATVRIIGRDENGLQVISQLLGETGNVSSLQIVSHGNSGAVYLGNSTLDGAALDNSATAAQLQGWQSGMTANADILILGCDVAQGDKGQSFVQKLADLTGADISASVDDTGAASKGGNWAMEFSVGVIDSVLVFKPQALTAYGDLLAAGPPTTTLTVDANPLIGSINNSGSVTFTNTGPIGYAPYITLGFDATGKDPSNTLPTPTEGVSFISGSATYLGVTLPPAQETILVFSGTAGPGGTATASTPGIKDNTGANIVFFASDYGLQAGDQLVILKLPLGSFATGQPNATVDFKYNVGADADSANTTGQGGGGLGAPGKGLAIVSRGFFQLGDTPTGTNAPDFQTGNTAKNVDPTWFTTEYRNSSREREQVPGANDKQRFQALLNIAPNQTVLSSDSAPFVSKLIIPSGLVFETTDITLRASDATSGAGVPNTVYAVKVVDALGNPTAIAAVQDPVTRIWTVGPGAPAGAKLEISATTTGGAADVPHTGNLTLNLEYFIPKNVVSNANGGDINASFDAKHTGRVKFFDGDDTTQAFTVDPLAIVLKYQSIQIQKGVAGTSPDLVDPANPAGVRSGDALTYTLSSQIGDYYGLRNVIVTDILPDGIDLVGATATVTIVANGETRTGQINIAQFLAAQTINIEGGGTETVGGSGKLVLQFDVSAWLASAANPGGAFALSSSTGGGAGDIYGDVFADAAFGGPIVANTRNGRTDITITYNAVVLDQYRIAANGNPLSGTKVNENDVLKNDVRISGTLLTSTGLVNPTIDTTNTVNSDESSAVVAVKDGALLLEIYAINGVIVTDPGVAKTSTGQPIIAPGDNVTYRIRYDTTQGDYTDLKLTAYLPDPVFSAEDASADGGAPETFTKATDTVSTTGPTANWAQAGKFALGPNSAALSPNGAGFTEAGTQNPDTVTAFTNNTIGVAATGNKLVFSLGSSDRASNPGGTANAQTRAGEKVDLLFTVKAKDAAFDPELILSAQGNENSQRSVNGGVGTATPLQDDKIIPIVLGTPKMVVSLGVLSKGTTGNQDGIIPTAGSVTAGSNAGLAGVQPPGTATTTAPFTGIITDAKQVDANITNVDAGDQVRFGFAIQNSGRSGAYGVRTEAITAPPGYVLASGNADIADPANNFQIRRGDGTLLTAGVDYNVVANVVTFVDRDLTTVPDGIIDPQFAAGAINGVARTDGKNIVVISYDAVAINAAYAGATSTSTVGVDKALAGASGTTNFVATPVRDTATLQNAKPQVDIRWQGDSTTASPDASNDDTSQQGDGATDAQMVIGEAGFFDLKVTIPEGTTKALFADINIPAGYKIDTAYNGGTGYDIITTVGGTGTALGASENGQLDANFGGAITNGVPAAGKLISNTVGTPGQPGGGGRIDLGDVTNLQNNASNNNSFVVRVRLIADNTATTQPNNQAGTASTITSNSRYNEGVNAATGAGGAATNVADTTTANDPTITIAEPVVTTVKTVAIVDVDPAPGLDVPGTEADENDVVEYTIVLNNPGPVAAYDLAFSDVFPTFVTGASLNITSVTSSGATVDAVARALTATDFTLTAGTRTLTFDTNKNIDLTANGTITVKVRATLNSTAATVTSFSNTAETTWSSLNDATNAVNPLERSGALGGALLANGTTTVDAGTGASSGANVLANTIQSPTGNGLNNYRTASSASVPVVALAPVLSHIGGLADTSPTPGDTKLGQNVAVGEITRFRMVTKVPAGQIANFSISPTLPTGYEYLGAATIALVSDSGMTSSLVANTAQLGDGTGSGSTAIFGDIQNTLNSTNFSGAGVDARAANTKPTEAITAGGTALAPVFNLGTLTNTDNDTDFEYVVIEFNAIVKNDILNQSGTPLGPVKFDVKTGATVLATSNNVTDTVVEPNISNLSKDVVDIQAGTQNSATADTNRITVRNSFTSNGGTSAYDTQFRDTMPGGTNAGNVMVSTDGGTTFTTLAAFTAATPGASSTVALGIVDIKLGDVAVGTTIVIKYDIDVPTTATPQVADTLTHAQVVFSSIPDIAVNSIGATGFGGSTIPGADGAANGERNGTLDAQTAAPGNDIAGAGLNNYRNIDPAGYGSIAGTLWDDTVNPNGLIDGTEALLDGVTVTLTWAGADGNFGSADDRIITTVTQAGGKYNFGALPTGGYVITVPLTTPKTDSTAIADPDTLAIRTDADAGTLGTINTNVAEAATIVVGSNSVTTRDFGYVQPNDPPQNLFGGSATFPVAAIDSNEDLPLTFNGTGANPAVISITDPDGGQGDGKLSTTLTVTNGTLALTPGATTVTSGAIGSTTITIEGTQVQINAALATLVYTPTNNYSGPATLTIKTNDRGQGGDANGNLNPKEGGGVGSPDNLFDTDVININVKPISDAPLLTIGNTNPGGTQATSPIALGTGLGNSLTQTVAGTATGVEDSPINLGISIAPADATGTAEVIQSTITISGIPSGWVLEDSLGNDITAAAATGLTPAQATGATITPPTDLNSTTTPPATLTVTVTSKDASDTVATTTGTLTIGVIPVNDRPVVNDVTPIVLASMAEGTANSPVQNVGTLFTPRFSDPKDTAKPNGADTMIGVFVTGSAANPTTEGAWEYFNGTAWVAIPATTTDATAIYLPNATNIRCTPVNSNYSGTPGQLTVRLVENDQTPAGSIIADVPNGPANGTTIGNTIDALTVGNVVNISTPVGSAPAFATGRVSEELKVGIVVTPVSDAPILTIGTGPQEPGNPAGTTGAESSPGAPVTGNTAAGTVTGSVRGVEDTPIPLNITVAPADSSNPEAVSTVVISGVPEGWILKDGAGNPIPTTLGTTAGLTPAQLLGATITAPTDANSIGPVGTSPAATLTITVTSTDGAAPPATTVGTLNVAVTPVNDRPVVNGTPADFTTIPEGTANSAARTVTAIFGGLFTDPKDTGKPNGPDTMRGVLVTGTAATASEGVWQYSTNGGGTWTAVPATTSDGEAIYLDNAAQLRFVPVDSNYSGTPGKLTVRLVENDQAAAAADVPNGAANGTTIGNSLDALTPGAVIDITTPVGSATPFATGRVSETTQVGIVITPVSDAPILTIGVGPQEAGNPAGTTGVESSPGSAVTGNNATSAVTGSVRGLEDTPIPLGISVAPADTSNPETVTTVVISGVPAGWVLTQPDGTVIPTTAGSTAGLLPAQIAGLRITAPVDGNSVGPVGTSPAATLTVTVSSQDPGAPAPAVTTGTLNVAVTPVNDRPVVTDATPIVLPAMAEGTTNSPVQNVGTLFTPRFSDPKDAAKPNGADTMIGVLVTGSAANATTEGAWEYFNGTTWMAVPASTTDATAIYLPNATNIRFTPVNSNYSGTPGQLTVRLVENDQTPAGSIIADVPNGAANGTTIGNSIDVLTVGAVVNIATPVGSTPEFATSRVSEELKVGIVVTPVSDAPILTIGTGPQEAGNPAGTTGVESSPGAPVVGNTANGTVTGSVRGTEETPIPLNITVAPADVTNPEAVSTVVISGVPAGWILKDGAGNPIPTTLGTTAGLTPAQLLGATITAPTDFNSVGPVGTSPAATLTITVTSTDGTAPPATTVGTLNVAVTPVNDAPLFPATTTTVLPAFNEDNPSAGVNVTAAFPGYTDPKDVGKPNGPDNRVGVLLTANATTPAQGNWQYFDGAAWVDVPRNLSDTNALYLPDGTQIRFNPALNYNGTPGNLTARLVEDDQAGANADLPANATGTGFGSTNAIRTGVNLSPGVGSTSRVSANTRDVSISVTPVNDTPVVTTPLPVLPVGDVPISFTNANSIVLSDVDTPFNPAAIVTVTITPTGNGRPFISALTPGVTQTSGPAVGTIPPGPGVPIVLTGTLADINATLQNLEYRSRQFYNGPDTFTVTINDNANGGPGPLQATATVRIDNLPLNDRPVVNGPIAPDYLPLSPGATTPGRTVQDLFGPRFTDPRDAPSNNGGDVFAGIAIISTPPASQGIYQYSTDGGSTWIAIAADTTSANALVLAPNAQLRFVSNPAYVGETTPLQALLIETDQKLPATGDLLNRPGIPFDSASSAPPISGTVLNLSTLEATELSTTTNGIGRSRFSSVSRPMLLGVRIDPPVAPQPEAPLADLLPGFTVLPAVLDQAAIGAQSQFVGLAVRQAQAEAAVEQVAADKLFASNLGNSGLQPNWLMPEGIPGLDPFSAPLPELDPKAIGESVVSPRTAMTAEEIARQIECAKPRVVAKPRPPGYVRPAPKFEPGSPAAKRFSEQLKRARARARC